MDLFGPKKEKKTVKVTDLLTEEEIREIRETIEPTMEAGAYKSVSQPLVNALSDYIKNPDKEITMSKLKTAAKVVDATKKYEPSLAPILDNGLERIKELQQG